MLNLKKTSSIIGCIYKHPNMNLMNLMNLSTYLFDKLSKENKTVLLLGCFINKNK